MEPVSDGAEPASWDELYSINLMPSELFLKFRKEVEGLRVGVNLETAQVLGFCNGLGGDLACKLYGLLECEKGGCGMVLPYGLDTMLYNAPTNDFHVKLVLKPLSPERRWKLFYEPIQQDVRVSSKKIPVNKYLNLQVGIGHNFKMNAINWKWKLTTCFGGDGFSRIRNKTLFGVSPGVDFRFGWRADYVLPEVTGGLGSSEALFNMSSGKLEASLDRIEAILTHT